MGAAYWTPTGNMRWFLPWCGEMVLQWELQRDGYFNKWDNIPIVVEEKPKEEGAAKADNAVGG